MYDDEGDQDPVSNALRSRRIPHGRSGKNARTGKASGRGTFDPLRAVGVYDVKFGSKKSKRREDEAEKQPVSSLTIHGLTQEETGLVASFNIGRLVVGMSILAGSRKGVKKIVAELEKEVSDEESTDEGEGGVTASANHDDDDDDDEDDDEDEDEATEAVPKSALEEADDRINRRAKAFEKNSFRNPKFWMHWRAHVTGSDGNEVNETNTGYIVFSGNDCATFEGTMSSEVLDWDNMRIKGHKMKSHAGECPNAWTDFD